MAWLSLCGLALVLWALCGAVILIGRRVWSLETTLYVHLAAAPLFAFALAAVHEVLFPAFDPLTRAAVMTALVLALDVFVVAPFVERSFAMFRGPIGTWPPFGLIFAASWSAGVL